MGKGVQPLPHTPPSLLPVFGIAELLPGSKSRLLEVEEGYNLQTWNLRRKNQPAKVAAEHARDCWWLFIRKLCNLRFYWKGEEATGDGKPRKHEDVEVSAPSMLCLPRCCHTPFLMIMDWTSEPGRETTALLLQIHKGVHVPRWEKYQKPMAILLDWMKRKGRHFLSILLWIPRQFKKHHWSDHWHWGGNAHPQKTCRAQPSLTWAVSGFWCNPFCKLPPHTHVNPCFLL